ncbi:MAG: FTR1 family protein [Alicyclobacillus sp.]|nr:FTR1 family protein [Alicyclobacillus sp.]
MLVTALLVALREGLEISLILGIIFAYLKKLSQRQHFKYVWLGSGAALVLAGALGSVLYVVTGEQEWSGQADLETGVFLVAVGILSYMTFWMKQNSRSLGRVIQGRVDAAVHRGGVWQIVFLAFITVIREVLELVMFLLAIADQGHQASPVAWGALAGLAIAAAVGWSIYRGTARLNLNRFFRIMGNALIVVAAGLLGNAVHSAAEAGIWHPTAYAYDLSSVLSAHSVVGSVLHALIGYSDHPSVLQAAVWVVYLAVALVLFNRGSGRPAQTAARA